MLRNIDRTDRELLLACKEVADNNGIIRSQALAEYLGVGASKGRSPAGRVSTRLSWMARQGYGMLERLDPKAWGFKSTEAIWTITPYGEEILQGARLPAEVARAINSTAGRRIAIMQELAHTGLYGRDRNVLRRQWQHDLENSKQ